MNEFKVIFGKTTVYDLVKCVNCMTTLAVIDAPK